MLAAEKETGGWSAVELAIEKQFRDEELYVNGAKTVFTFFNFAILLLSSLAFLLQPFFARPNDSNTSIGLEVSFRSASHRHSFIMIYRHSTMEQLTYDNLSYGMKSKLRN